MLNAPVPLCTFVLLAGELNAPVGRAAAEDEETTEVEVLLVNEALELEGGAEEGRLELEAWSSEEGRADVIGAEEDTTAGDETEEATERDTEDGVVACRLYCS